MSKTFRGDTYECKQLLYRKLDRSVANLADFFIQNIVYNFRKAIFVLFNHEMSVIK